MKLPRGAAGRAGSCWLAVVVLLLIACRPSAASTLHDGEVVHIADGDTLTILVGIERRKIRLSEIDAPELGQLHGEAARKTLGELVFGRRVQIVEVDRDRYGRIVGRVYLGEFNVNAAMVRKGHAWVYRKYARDKGLVVFEREAKAARRGLWASAGPVPPWDWRRGERATVRSDQPTRLRGAIVGNARSKKYHLPGCPGYDAVSEQNRVLFFSRGAAEAEGYRLAGNCR